MKSPHLLSVAIFATGLAGCSAAGPGSQGALPLTVTSDAHLLSVEVSATTEPVVGTNTVELTLTRMSDGAPQDGLEVSIVPWMPAMDHGTSTPTVTPKGHGRYEVSDLYLFMPGTWVLKATFSGPMSDHAEPEFQIQ
jgi:hypothetical protein